MSESELLEDPNQVVIPLEDSLSDGSKSTWPLKDPRWNYRPIDDSRWRAALALAWVEETGAYEKGVEYTLEKLPEGYCLFDRPRGKDPKIRDVFLFGHPSGRYFQSRPTFFPHFRWLMSERTETCTCKLCNRESGPHNKESAPRSRRTKAEMEAARAEAARTETGRAEFKTGRIKTDTEAGRAKSLRKNKHSSYILKPMGINGPDYWRAWIKKMKQASPNPVDIKVWQPLNKDWVFGKDLLDTYFAQLSIDHSFIPRKGETVLFVNEMNGTLQFHKDTQTFQVFGYDGEWKGTPEWRAGIVTQTPAPGVKKTYALDIHDSANENALATITNTGFRVECLPDPVDDDKSFSIRNAYVPLNCMKPMNSWELFMHRIPREKWHPTIEFALTSTSSFSMLHFTWFRGTWPTARIHCMGIWVGHELLAVRDTIRLKPFKLTLADYKDSTKEVDRKVTDVMTISDIWLEWTGCVDDENANEYAKKVTAWIEGKVYTLDKNRLNRPCAFGNKPLEELDDHETDCAFNQVGMSEYGQWYRMNGNSPCRITPGSVLGRCYEPVPTKLHYGSFGLGYDLQSVLKARQYSVETDNRIPVQNLWFFGDNRVETLGLAEVNGIEVGPAAEVNQEPDRWLSILKISEGIHTKKDIETADLGREQGKRGHPRKNFAGGRLVSTGLGINSSSGESALNSETNLSEGELARPNPFTQGDTLNHEDEDEWVADKEAQADDEGSQS